MKPEFEWARNYAVKNWGVCTLLLAFALSLALNIHLGLAAHASPAVASGSTQATLVGHSLPSVKVRNAEGVSSELGFAGGRETVLYALAPDCPWCAKNFENIGYLAKAETNRYRFVGIAIGVDSAVLKKHLAAKPLPFDVYTVEASEWIGTEALRATPTTVVVDSGGVVRQVWVGAYGATVGTKIESFFDVKLPGLVAIQ